MPLLNILVLCRNDPPKVVSIVDCTSYMIGGGKQGATHIMAQFQKKVNDIDQYRMLTNCFIFDGSSNVQTSHATLCGSYSWAICFFGGGHVLSLFSVTSQHSNPYQLVYYYFFFTLFFLYIFQLHFVKCCRLYNGFGSGASHGINAQLIAQTIAKKIVHCQVQIGFATWFYGMHKVLWQKPALMATLVGNVVHMWLADQNVVQFSRHCNFLHF